MFYEKRKMVPSPALSGSDGSPHFCEERANFGSEAVDEHNQHEHGYFEVRNDSGKTARGIEIELTGLCEGDVFRVFPLNRIDALSVFRDARSVRVHFESSGRLPVHSLSRSIARQRGEALPLSQKYLLEIGLYGGGGSDRFCVELSTLNIHFTYRWLIAKNEFADVLTPFEAPAFAIGGG